MQSLVYIIFFNQIKKLHLINIFNLLITYTCSPQLEIKVDALINMNAIKCINIKKSETKGWNKLNANETKTVVYSDYISVEDAKKVRFIVCLLGKL